MVKLRLVQLLRMWTTHELNHDESDRINSAWHGYKYIDPAESGAVLPIVHVNGFKISERTIYGCMDDKEMVALFTGYGYQARFVEDLDDIDADISASMDWALGEIRKIQQAARSGKPIMKPRWPVLIMRTPKVTANRSEEACLDIDFSSRDGRARRKCTDNKWRDRSAPTKYLYQLPKQIPKNSRSYKIGWPPTMSTNSSPRTVE